MQKTVFTFAFLMLAGAPLHAEQLSPWMGNSGQEPFQIDTRTMAEAVPEADRMATGTLAKAEPCKVDGCIARMPTAKPYTEQNSVPQN